MNVERAKKIFLLFVGALFIVWGIFKLVEEKRQAPDTAAAEQTIFHAGIAELTSEIAVTEFVRRHGYLPEYYLTKEKARRQGWNASKGNLCDVLPGKAIGGDRFGNREGRLPAKAGRIWYEADLNYNCGRRGPHRLLFSNDGLIFVSRDHYKTFDKK